MKGSAKSRRETKSQKGLRFRCVQCRCLRKYDAMDTGQGGERHASPPPMQVGRKAWKCGWCILRAKGVQTFTAFRDDGTKVVRDVRTGRVLGAP